jgi:hypothetical protein
MNSALIGTLLRTSLRRSISRLKPRFTYETLTNVAHGSNDASIQMQTYTANGGSQQKNAAIIDQLKNFHRAGLVPLGRSASRHVLEQNMRHRGKRSEISLPQCIQTGRGLRYEMPKHA